MRIMIHVLETNNGEFYNTCYIIENMQNHKGILIDPAWDSSKFEQLISTRKIKPECILLTHSHIDHIDLVDYFTKKYNTTVYISEEEAFYYDYTCKNMIKVKDEKVITIHGIDVKCHLTPGHTKGSMCFEIGDNLFVGDTVFYEGCGNCSYSLQAVENMFDSIQKIKNDFSEICRIYPGHIYNTGVGQTLINIKRNNLSFMLDYTAFISYQMSKQKHRLRIS